MPTAARPMSLDGEKADVEADQRVEAKFAGDDHAHGDGSFREGVRQPAMEPEHGNFDGEGDEEGESGPAQRFRREHSDEDGVAQGVKTEGARAGVEPENGDQ